MEEAAAFEILVRVVVERVLGRVRGLDSVLVVVPVPVVVVCLPSLHAVWLDRLRTL